MIICFCINTLGIFRKVLLHFWPNEFIFGSILFFFFFLNYISRHYILDLMGDFNTILFFDRLCIGNPDERA